MPWSQTTPMDQKTQFIADYLRESVLVHRAVRALRGESRDGLQVDRRYLEQGPQASRSARADPTRARIRPAGTSSDALLEVRRRHPTWGAKKLLALVAKRHPRWELPARSHGVRDPKRNGMVPKKRRRRASAIPAHPTSPILAPNDVWCADFKGQFKTGDGLYCYPLTVTDDYSRYPARLPGAALDERGRGQAGVHAALQGVRPAQAHPHRQRRAVRDQHAGAAVTAVGLVGAPGRDARAHRAGQAAAERAPRAHASDAQGRDHATAGGEPVGAAAQVQSLSRGVQQRAAARGAGHADAGLRYEPSPREMPNKLPPLEYPDRFEVRYVSANGGIRWNCTTGSTSRPSASASTSASRRSTTESGTSTSGR